MKSDSVQSLGQREFSRYAHSYESYNIIQKEVAKTLLQMLSEKEYKTIIDIGCGSGTIYKYLNENNYIFNKFIAVDASKEMLEIHPQEYKIRKILADFDTQKLFDLLPPKSTLLLSSSALQWSKELDFTLAILATKAEKAYFSIFTANTFKTLHNTAHIVSPIYKVKELKESIEKYYNVIYHLKSYKLYFTSIKEMFEYIKKSGVSGGERQLSYREIKQLMKEYPLNYLEFEVLFVEATSLASCK